MRKLFTLLIMILAAPAFSMTNPKPMTPNASMQSGVGNTIALLTIDVPGQWNSAAEVSDVYPTDAEPVKVKLSTCSIGPLPAKSSLALGYGQTDRFDEFSKWQCSVTGPFGITFAVISGGTANVYTNAQYKDANGQTSTIDVPAFTDFLPVSPTKNADGIGGSDAVARVERVSNGYGGRSTYFGLFTVDKPTNMTIKVYDRTNTNVGTEYVQLPRDSFYGLKTKVEMGRAEIYNGWRDYGGNCESCKVGQSGVYIIEFAGQRDGGSPRVEIPPISRSVWMP